MSTTTTEPVSGDQRRQHLDSLIVQWTGGGWNLASRTDYQAVMSKGHRPNHILHLILSIVTVGLWIPVWIIVSITSGEKRKTITVDEYDRAYSR